MTNKLVIQYHTNSHIKVFGDRSAEMELKEQFEFYADGYMHSPKFKARLWNGKISLYNLATKRIPAGLLNKVIEYCERNEITYELDNFPKQEDILITPEQLTKFIQDLDIRNKGNKIEVRDYQFDCILKSINSRRLVSKVPTSGGKSLIIYIIMRWLLENELRFILVVPTVMLVGQMYTDFQDYSSHNGFAVEDLCHKLHGGEAKEFQKPVLISTWQSISAMDRVKNNAAIWNSYDAVCIDEAHAAKGKELSGLLEKMTEVSFRFGTTGTIDSNKVNQLTIEGHIGPIYSAITTRELIDRNQVSNIQINAMILKYPEAEAKLVKDYDYPGEMKYLCSSERRNIFIRNIALATTGTTLILVQNVETHAVPLYKLISEKSTRPVYYISGSIESTIREEIRQKAMVENCIIVSTFGTMSTGVNVPNIRNIIFGSPSKSMIRVLQSIGRGLRLHKDKSKMILIDLIDDLKHKKRLNFALSHFAERLKIYQIEKFPIKIQEINLT